MGCLNNFISTEALLNSGDLDECDIIEFNRVKYSYYSFYIGNGICVNVTGPDFSVRNGSSNGKNYSNEFPKGMKMA